MARPRHLFATLQMLDGMVRRCGEEMRMTLGWSGLVIGAFALLGMEAAAADPLGLWRDSDGTTIRIQRCGPALCGTIVSMTPPNDPATGNPWTDRHNPEQTKRGDPLIGRQVFIEMQPAGAGKWSGTLYNTDDGRSLRGNLVERGPEILRVEGCVGTRCGGENLSRVGR